MRQTRAAVSAASGEGTSRTRSLKHSLGLGVASHRLIEHREAGSSANVLRVETDFLFEVRLGFLVALESRQRVADHEMQIPRLRAAARVTFLRLEQESERRLVLLWL